jgi:hypothetical protein
MPDDLSDGIVRILNAKNETAGTGFVVRTTKEHGVPINSPLIITCAHVIAEAKASPGGKVSIRYLKANQLGKALVKAEWWRPPEKCDIAVLQPLDGMPTGVRLLELGHSSGTATHRFDTFGFPFANPEKGVPDTGSIIGPYEWGKCKVLRLDTSGVSSGFSGAPVWDRLRQRVVGVISRVLFADAAGAGGNRAMA